MNLGGPVYVRIGSAYSTFAPVSRCIELEDVSEVGGRGRREGRENIFLE